MPDLAIRVDNLSKRYQLGSGLPQHGLREIIQQQATGLWRRIANRTSPLPPTGNPQTDNPQEDFWALRNLSFDVNQGEVVGVIGRNGAGKSTLLKILSRITEPTAGKVEIHGRVGSLLEVGTGFHPELTGRENIFLNGAILGMSQAEIRRNLDAIVEFSGIERFLETPVKRYSSGMYVRLAFAVAAHLQPEILVVDEVLAVGDAEFQAKCLGKMQDVAQQGRTVLFVSHNLAAVQSLCTRAILLEGGKVIADDSPQMVAKHYLSRVKDLAKQDLSERTDRQGNGKLRFQHLNLLDRNNQPLTSLQTGQYGAIELEIFNATNIELPGVTLSLGISDEQGNRVCFLNNELCEPRTGVVPAAGTRVRVELEKVPLIPGEYTVTLYSTALGEITDWVIDGAELSVVEGDFFGTGKSPPPGQGSILIPHRIHFSDF